MYGYVGPFADRAVLSSADDISFGQTAGIYARVGKRLFDVAFALVSGAFVAPLVLALAAFVKLDGGPAFFGHERVGRDGRIFKCYKIRTMVPDAQAQLETYLAKDVAARAIWESVFKLPNDPRVTKFGTFLRKTSLDELPQFLNVFLGDMSVVGPRPVTLKEVEMYGPKAALVQSVRPGVTGLWQVSGRNDVSYEERVKLDETYVNQLSLSVDVAIIWQTIFAVLRRTGV